LNVRPGQGAATASIRNGDVFLASQCSPSGEGENSCKTRIGDVLVE
jgi:hypothetical protein